MARFLTSILTFACYLVTITCHGQEVKINEITVCVDNDQFTLDATDRYYSNGIMVTWSRAVDKVGFLNWQHLKKAVITAGVRHKIYTPSEITFYEESRHDRPYASTLEITGGLRMFGEGNQFLQTDIALGVVGRAAQGQKLQEWWHDQIRIFRPRGWDNQITNSLVANFHLQFSRQWFHRKSFDFISTSELSLGTILTNVRQGGMIRIGKLLPLNASGFAGGNLGNHSAASQIEVYFFARGVVEYVNHNGLIEGNRIGKQSPHTREPVPWVFHHEYGIQLSTEVINTGFSIHNLSKELKDGLMHRYASIILGIRF